MVTTPGGDYCAKKAIPTVVEAIAYGENSLKGVLIFGLWMLSGNLLTCKMCSCESKELECLITKGDPGLSPG